MRLLDYDNVIISFMVINYNISNIFLKKCIDSLLDIKKEFDNLIEIVLIDNGSSKEYKDYMVNNYSKNNNIVYHRIEKNNHKSGAFREYWSKCKGDYIKVSDPDDWVDKKDLYEILNTLIVEKPEFVITNYRYYNNERNIFRDRILRREIEGFKVYDKHNPLPSYLWHGEYNIMFNKKFMIDNNYYLPKNIKSYEDVYNQLWFVSKANKIIYFNLNLIIYRIKHNKKLNLSSTSKIIENVDHFGEIIKALTVTTNFDTCYHKLHFSYHFALPLDGYLLFKSLERPFFVRKYYVEIFKEIKEKQPNLAKSLRKPRLHNFNLLGIVFLRGWSPYVKAAAWFIYILRK